MMSFERIAFLASPTPEAREARTPSGITNFHLRLVQQAGTGVAMITKTGNLPVFFLMFLFIFK